MEKKVLLIGALVTIFSFGLLGTAVAGSISYPAGVISNLDHTTAEIDAKLEAKHGVEGRVSNHTLDYAPAGVISNLDHTTAEIDAQLYPESVLKHTEPSILCNAPAGHISNKDHTTAAFDATTGC